MAMNSKNEIISMQKKGSIMSESKEGVERNLRLLARVLIRHPKAACPAVLQKTRERGFQCHVGHFDSEF